jgi:4-hydroxy-tetrahydrodipicolinate synthase
MLPRLFALAESGRWTDTVAAWRAGDAVPRRLAAPLTAFAAALFAEPNPSVLKAVLYARGRIAAPDVRLPLLPAHPDTVEAALAELDTALSGSDMR